MTTLLGCGRSAAVKAVGYAVGLFAAAGVAGQASGGFVQFQLTGATLEYYGGNALSWQSYPDVGVTLGSAPIENGVRVFGTGSGGSPGDTSRAVSISGGQWRGVTSTFSQTQTMLTIFGTSTFSSQPFQWVPNVHLGEVLSHFSFGFTGGSCYITQFQTALFGYRPNGSFINSPNKSGFTQSVPGSSPAVRDVQASHNYPTDSFGMNPPPIGRIDWIWKIGFNWTEQSAGDQFWVSIPPTSIDVRLIPAPAGAGLAAMALLAAGRRRRVGARA